MTRRTFTPEELVIETEREKVRPEVAATGNTLCTARRRNGKKCGNYAIWGGTVCRKHGGAAPQVVAKAKQRLMEAAGGAASNIIKMQEDKRIPAAVRLAASKDVLDRAGVTPKQELKVEVTTFEKIVKENAVLVDLDDDEDQ